MERLELCHKIYYECIHVSERCTLSWHVGIPRGGVSILCLILFVCLFVCSEHTQVTPGLPMLQDDWYLFITFLQLLMDNLQKKLEYKYSIYNLKV